MLNATRSRNEMLQTIDCRLERASAALLFLSLSLSIAAVIASSFAELPLRAALSATLRIAVRIAISASRGTPFGDIDE